ncbi:MAG: phosphate acyltransferase PlsX [Chloroflexi bacterium]|nr:phosphate acyltransferase PlsX [Chloroflexota bacterium]
MSDKLPEGMITIALDAMGGDHGPPVMVPAALKAIGKGGIAVALVGDAAAIELELAKYDAPAKRLVRIVPSDGVIPEGANPALALRAHPRASVLVAAGAVKAGKADAFVSMGSTGASIAASTVLLGTIDGIDRGALGGPIVGYAPDTVIIDLGTNVDTRPAQLADFAALGSLMSRLIYGKKNPRVALLSVGSEEGKGNAQVKATTLLLRASSLNFIGNIEPHDLPAGKAEVVVCDGFVGNIVLKLTEGLGRAIAAHIRSALPGSPEADALADEVFARTNMLEVFGGGPLLGLKGAAIVGHGSSGVDAVAGAIATAKVVIDNGYINAQHGELERIRSEIAVT